MLKSLVHVQFNRATVQTRQTCRLKVLVDALKISVIHSKMNLTLLLNKMSKRHVSPINRNYTRNYT